jgi:SAM-dependent methyltransferase
MDSAVFSALLTDRGAHAVAEAVVLLDGGLDALAVTEQVRRRFGSLSPAATSAAVTQATLRRRARTKFGPAADDMWFTADGLEQATRSAVADHRASRFAALGDDLGRRLRVADLCCGIGADLLALAAAGCDVTGIDRDPLTALVAEANVAAARQATARVECLDVQALDLRGFDAAFIDPSRRAAGRRTFDIDGYRPSWSFVTATLAAMPSAAAKVAPGIPHEVVPPGIETEWVSIGGALKEAVLWAGGLAAESIRRRATLLPSGAAMSSTTATMSSTTATMSSTTMADEPPATGPMRRYLYEPDDAVVRAHLIGDLARSLDGVLPDPTTAYITSDRLIASPFVRAFEVSSVMPFSLKRLRTALRERQVGAVTIMKRGSAVDVEQLRHDLRLSGGEQAVVVLALIGGRHHAVIAQPAPRS